VVAVPIFILMDKYNKQLLILISLFAVVAGLYVYRASGLFFLADDFIHIPQSSHNLLAQRNSLRPIGNISLHIDFLWSGKLAMGYHVTNSLLHITNSVLVFYFFKILQEKYAQVANNNLLAFLVSTCFFVYPFHSEAVFWIIGRSGSLGCLFFLVAFISFLQKEKSIAWFIACLLSFEFGLLAYESCWVFPLVVLLFFIFLQKNKKQWLYVAAIWLVFAIHLVYRYQVTGELLSKYDTASILQFNIKTIALNFSKLVARTLLPPFVNHQNLILVFVVVSLLLCGLIITFLRKQKQQKFFVLLSSLWLISYIPYISLGIDTHGVEGERYLYLPSVLFCCWLLYLLYHTLNKTIFTIAIVLLFCLNIFYLLQARSYYTQAGMVTQTTIKQIKNYPWATNIFIENLPQYNKGAVVFRLGFEESVQWLLPQAKQKIIIVSIDSSDVQVSKNYYNQFSVINYTDTFAKQVKALMVKDMTYKKTYTAKDTTNLFFNPATNVWFSFSDTALTINSKK
jgi:hypothetical protein